MCVNTLGLGPLDLKCWLLIGGIWGRRILVKMLRARRGRFLVGICVSVRKHVLKLTVGLWEIIAKTAFVGLQKNWRLL